MIYSNYLRNAKRIAIVADDEKSTDLIEWSYFNKDVLQGHELIATDKIGDLLEGTVQTAVNKLLSAEEGGYEQMTAMVKEGKIDIIFFMGKTAPTDDGDPERKLLLETAILKNVIVSCNKATRPVVLASLTVNTEGASVIETYPYSLKRTLSAIRNHTVEPWAATV
jgi:methylglyoxal synthase